MNLHFNRFGLLVLGALIAFPSSAAEYVPKIITGVIQSNEWGYDTPEEGFYQLEAVPGGKLTRMSTERDIYAAPIGGAVYEDGKMYGIHYRAVDDPFYESGYTFYAYSVEYDMKTFKRVKAQYLGDLYMNLVSTAGMTHDPVTGLNYGYFINPDLDFNVLSRNLATIDFVSQSTPKKTKIADFTVSENYAAMAAGYDGRLYVIDHNGYLYTMSKTTGSTTLIGDLGVSDVSTYPSSLTFDPRTKKLYWSFVDSRMRSYLYEVNYAVGSVSATRIMELPGDAILVNMYIAAPEAGDDAPAAVTGLAANFQGESYSGTVTFTMPTTTYAGDALSGALTYKIYANGAQVASSSAAAGAPVSATVTVPATSAGDTEIKVVASNSAGDGAPAETSLYIGLDTPEAIPAVTFTYDNATNRANVNWTAPVAGIHGLTLTPSNITYNVVRYPGAVKVATAQSATSFSETLDGTQALKSYYYEITPVNSGKYTGESTASNKVVVGSALTPPFTENFTTDAGFDAFTVIDANNDGTTWKRYHQVYEYSGTVANYARIDAHRENADDDWLIVPPMNLRKGAVYQLDFAAKKEYSGSSYNQQFEVKIGTDLNTANYTSLLSAQAYDVNFADFSKEIVVDADGIYYIGFHAISKAASGPLDIDYVSLKLIADADAPKAVTGFAVTPDATGALTATATFKAPTESLHGDRLDKITKIEVTDAQGNVVGTSLAPAPGADVTVKLNVKVNGQNTFTAIPYVGTNPGHQAVVSVFVGEDYPQAPTNIKLTDNGEYAVLTWDAVATGANGQFVNPSTMKFHLGTIDDVWGYFIPLKSNITSPYNTEIKSAEGKQSLLYYALRAETRAGQGEPAASNSLVVGKPYDAPFEISFASDWGSEDKFVWIEGEDADWNMGRTSDISSDGDGYAFIFTPNMAEYGIFNLGKINLATVNKPVLTFDYYVYPLAATSISVAVDKFPQGNAETLKNIYFYNQSNEGWQTAVVDLSKYKNEKFVIVKFAMTASSKATPAVIDNVRVVDESAGVENVLVDGDETVFDVYTTDGRLVRRQATTLDGLAPGFYIAGGKKVLVK